MFNTQCPRCNQYFSVQADATRAFCPNPACPAIVCFAFFEDKRSAVAFRQGRQSWQHTSLNRLADLDKWMVSYFNKPIVPYSPASLSELISREVLQSIQAGFADYLGGSLTLFEVLGFSNYSRIEPLPRKSTPVGAPAALEVSKMRNFTEFCKTLRQHKTKGELKGDQECHKSNCWAIDEIAKSSEREASWHFCWCGLVEFTAPIVVEGRVLGVIFSGQKRPKNLGAQREMRTKVESAAHRLGLDAKTMIGLAFAEDLEEVDDDDIETKKRELQRLALDIQGLATSRYRSEREIRQRQFLDALEGIFTETIEIIGPDPKSVWPILELVLKGIRTFTSFPLAGMFLVDPARPGFMELVAGNLRSAGTDQEMTIIEASPLDMDDLQRKGPMIIKADSQHSPSSPPFLQKVMHIVSADDLEITCLIPISSFGYNGVLVLTSLPQEIPSSAIHYIDSKLGEKFLRNMAHTTSEHLDICLAVAKVKEDQAGHRRLMVSLGHEINTPIQSMLADASNILNELPPGTEVKEIAEHNLEEVMRLHLLSENIIAVLSQRDKVKVPEFTKHSIYRPLREACEMFKSEARAKGCDIVGPRSIRSQFPVIEMSLFDLILAFKNLVHNAVKYSFYPPKDMEVNRFIKVTGQWAGREHDKYAVEICNYGVGITPEEIEEGRIFQPHYRGKWASDRHRTGSGLGLTHAKQVIEEMHHGKIEVRSIPVPGTAYLTIFKVILPVSQPKIKEEV